MSLAPTNPQLATADLFKSLEDGLSSANEIMQIMSNHKVMTMAPSPLRKSYLKDVFESISLKATNKKRDFSWKARTLARES